MDPASGSSALFRVANLLAHPVNGEQRNSRTAAGTVIPTDTGYHMTPRLHITDIAFNGHIASQQQFSLVPSESNNIEKALHELPEIPSGHARIYDFIAGEISSQLEIHLRPLFPGMPKIDPKLKSLISHEDSKFPQETVRSQWARKSNSTARWSPLHVPCTYFPVNRQYDDLDPGPSFALFSCNRTDVDTLIVLYERPYVVGETSRALGYVYADVLQQEFPQDNARSRVVFVKLLLLVMFQLHIERLTRICQHTFPSTSHEMLYRGAANVPKTIARIRNCTEYHKHVCQLVDMVDLTTRNLEIETTGSPPTALAEYVLDIRSLSTQLAKISQDNMDRYQKAWEAYRDILNVHESQGVKRLTMLATIFLPLSLSSSILAMSTRLAHLHILLYDFVGVFLILGSLALVFYIIITFGNKVSDWLGKQKVLALIMTEKKSRSRWAFWLLVLGRLRNSGIIVIALFWIGLTVSFVIGMVDDVIYGLKFLGYYLAGMAAFVLMATYANWPYEVYRYGARSRQKRHALEIEAASAEDSNRALRASREMLANMGVQSPLPEDLNPNQA